MIFLGLQDYQAATEIDPHNTALRADTDKIREVIQGTTWPYSSWKARIMITPVISAEMYISAHEHVVFNTGSLYETTHKDWLR